MSQVKLALKAQSLYEQKKGLNMTDPVTAAALVATVGGAGISAFGAYRQGQAASQAADYNAQLARNKAVLARQNAEWESAAGTQKIEQKQMDTRANLGQIKANQASAGIDVNRGSAVDTTAGVVAAGQQDVTTLRTNAIRKAYGYQLDADADESRASLMQVEGKNAKTASKLQATADLLGGLGSAGGAYAKYKSRSSLDGGMTGIDTGE